MAPIREREATPGRPPAPPGAERDAFVARLQRIVGHWRSADRLARAMGVSPSAFRKWLKGEAEPSRERLVALAEASGVGIAWLATGEGPQPRFREAKGTALADGALDPSQFLVLPKPMEGKAAAAGAVTPMPPDAQASAFVAFGHDWIRRSFGIEPENLTLETAVGESMSPTIADGDMLLIDSTDRRFREFGIYVLEYGGQRLVKRVQRKLDGSLVLISDNAVYEPERIADDRASAVKALGRVVWSGGKL
ncbi:MAG: helix-turn-helix transcriptional regulator [Acetobacteraceae bacterium]